MTISRDDDVVSYTSRRRWPRSSKTTAATTISVRIGELLADGEVTDLDHFLSARWALGTSFGQRDMWAEVDHQPWPLHRAHLVTCEESAVVATGLPAPTGEAHVLWSPGVEVRIARPRVVKPARP
jgi:uncharacterized protein YqjF (DUF2071 family)